jgi:uncharacterized protein
MTPSERRLLAILFDRLRGTGAVPRNPEADRLIKAELKQQPHAGYVLVQTVLAQDLALRRAGAKMGELERQIELLKAASPAGAASFLGDLGDSAAAGDMVQPEPRSAAAGRRRPVEFLPAALLGAGVSGQRRGGPAGTVLAFPGAPRLGLEALRDVASPLSYDPGVLPPDSENDRGRNG